MMEESNNTANYHLDKNLILLFVFTILVTASIFAYKFINYAPCEIEAFNFSKGNLRVGEIIRFKDNTKGVIKREWDFGDGSRPGKISNPFHTYTKSGEYIVKLQVNGSCKWEEKLTIKEKAFVLDSSRIAKFDIPDKIEVGEKIQLFDKTKEATSWEWRFGESGRVDATQKNPEYVYESPGEKTILLIVNNDPRYGFKKRVNVFEKEIEIVAPPRGNPPVRRTDPPVIPDRPDIDPISIDPPVPLPPPPPTRKNAPNIGEEKFKTLLALVSAKKATADNFKEYLCNDVNLPIQVNNKDTTFKEFCKKIRGKGIKIKELNIKKGDYNCITSIEIKYSNLSIFN
ncbi:hypothetical protein GCM10022393_32130 [Aquimarina addita]|uniref:PKD domain-containing protein n=1 Tax=Aquimarina addita TaxID=870485 RepID=A0ABP6URQ6_9FLAO